MLKRILHLLPVVILLMTSVPLASAMPASPVRMTDDQQNQRIPVAMTDRLSRRTTRNLADTYARANQFVDQSVEATLSDLCAGTYGILATSTPAIIEDYPECAGLGVVEMIVAIDGVVLIASDGLDFTECLTMEQVITLFGRRGDRQAERWNQLDSRYPDRTVSVYVPNTQAFSQQYFVEEVLKDAGQRNTVFDLRDQPLSAINERQSSIGYISLKLFLLNALAYKEIQLENNGICTSPTVRNVSLGEYPLSRPIYWYALADGPFSRNLLLDFFRYAFGAEGRQQVFNSGAWFPTEDISALSLANFEDKVTGNILSTLGQRGQNFEIRLAWTTPHDLDLGMRLPGGEEINFQNLSGGGFYRDANEGNEYCERLAESPFERVIAVDRNVPSDTYIAVVQRSFSCTAETDDVSFVLDFVVNGIVLKRSQITLTADQTTYVEAFVY